jgi:hypothetical protein
MNGEEEPAASGLAAIGNWTLGEHMLPTNTDHGFAAAKTIALVDANCLLR